MSDIGVALRTKLLSVQAVSDLVGTRVYPDQLPQGATLPAAVYHKISGVDEADLAGIVQLQHGRLQIDAYASTRLASDALATAIRNAICDASGSRGTWGSVSVSACTPAGGPRDDTQPLDDGSDEHQYISIRDYLISYHG